MSLIHLFTNSVSLGPFLVASLLCLLAGLLSFASPCVIPLVPGYLAFLASLLGQDFTTFRLDKENMTNEQKARLAVSRKKILCAALFFVLGFSVVFLCGSASLLGLVQTLNIRRDLLERVGGCITLGLAFVFLGLFRHLQKNTRVQYTSHFRKISGLPGAFILGGTFALGWTPCIGPTLAGVLSIVEGTSGGQAVVGCLLVLIYCFGLGIPFLLVAYGSHKVSSVMDIVRKHIRVVQLSGGFFLSIIGILLLTGTWDVLLNVLRENALFNWTPPL